jgi:hypothetical protein
MPEPEITDKSLLRCTVKKSASVLEKLILYVSYVIVGLTIAFFAFYGLVGVWAVLYPAPVVIYAILLSIPWYYYAGAAALGAIPVYSLLWCVTRELTEEDWKAGFEFEATVGVGSLFIGIPALIIGIVFKSIANIQYAYDATFDFAGTTLLFLAVACFLLGGMAVLSSGKDGEKIEVPWCYHAIRFIPATYSHYKNKKTEPVAVT